MKRTILVRLKVDLTADDPEWALQEVARGLTWGSFEGSGYHVDHGFHAHRIESAKLVEESDKR